MGSIAYTAARALTGGAVVGDPITRDVGFGTAVRSTRPVRRREVALAGNEENVLQRIETTWAVTTGHHLEAERAELDMWLRSVINGESFSIDFVGTIAVPDVVRTVRLLPGTLTETAVVRGAFRYSFTVLEP